jgi:predicted SAM-dependent methyltransferase
MELNFAMILDIGCGDVKKGHIGVDLRKTKFIDVQADAHFLPFKTGIFDHVYSSEVIEHFSHRETKIVLAEWIRVLKKGGIFEVECPDLRARSLIFFINPTWKNIENVYGGQDYAGNFHKAGFSYELLKTLLEDSGIKEVKRVIKGYKGIPFLPDCLHLIGTKS